MTISTKNYIVFGKLSVIEIPPLHDHAEFFHLLQSQNTNKNYHYFFITPQNNATGYKKEEIEQIKNILKMISEITYTIIVIGKSEKMSESPANSLLLLLENISDHTAILFLTHNKNNLLPTILSRAICFNHIDINNTTKTSVNDLLKLFISPAPFLHTINNLLENIEWEEKIFSEFLHELIILLSKNNYSYELIKKTKEIYEKPHLNSKSMYKYTLQIIFMLIHSNKKN